MAITPKTVAMIIEITMTLTVIAVILVFIERINRPSF
jgi:hypothetical protein